MNVILGSDGYYVWEKGSNVDFSQHFNTLEFECHCEYSTCQVQKLSGVLLGKLEKIRELLEKPLIVRSGFRCAAHQEDLRQQGFDTAIGISQHELGNAVDLYATDMHQLQLECEKEFKAIGVAKTFLHVDLRDDKQRRWAYLAPSEVKSGQSADS